MRELGLQCTVTKRQLHRASERVPEFMNVQDPGAAELLSSGTTPARRRTAGVDTTAGAAAGEGERPGGEKQQCWMTIGTACRECAGVAESAQERMALLLCVLGNCLLEMVHCLMDSRRRKQLLRTRSASLGC